MPPAFRALAVGCSRRCSKRRTARRGYAANGSKPWQRLSAWSQRCQARKGKVPVCECASAGGSANIGAGSKFAHNTYVEPNTAKRGIYLRKGELPSGQVDLFTKRADSNARRLVRACPLRQLPIGSVVVTLCARGTDQRTIDSRKEGAPQEASGESWHSLSPLSGRPHALNSQLFTNSSEANPSPPEGQEPAAQPMALRFQMPNGARVATTERFAPGSKHTCRAASH